VIEPLNVRVDHPGYFLARFANVFKLVKSIDSPNVKVLFDIYHQQITEGDVTRQPPKISSMSVTFTYPTILVETNPEQER